MGPPSSIGHYRITSKLGEGGMGAVYRATDTKLNRDVAIKILPEAFASDAGRMARFEREAQLLASLNHPNIATIYGVEQGALIMELVEGADLAGPVPVETAIQYARQIAAGLEAAHEKGIIHRDLKPANIKITPEGVVKLLDFGLARSTEDSSPNASSPTMSPTLSLAMTQAGMILGTAAYMAPEQARGKPVDKRADIWAFGVVLFELLTGGMLYGGETVSDSMAAVITREPDWTALPAGTPPHIRRLLARCLRKDPKQRLRDIGEARILLDEPGEAAAAPSSQATTTRRSWLPWALAGISIALALALGALLWRATRPTEKPLLRFNADLSPEAVAGVRITAAISPDGTRLAYPVRPVGGSVTMLATRLMDQSKPAILSGTENAQDPFFSPDGQWIGFFADGRLHKVSVQGGAPVTLCEAAGMRGADWGEDGNIVFGVAAGGARLARVPSSGGTPQSLGKPPESTGSQRWPQILPGGQAILFTGGATSSFDDASIEVLILKTGEIKNVQRGGYFGRYLPSGHLVYIHQGTLFAVPFDLGRNQTRGMPAPILEDVAGNANSGGGQLDFSRTGTLVYLSGKPGTTTSSLSWLNAQGKKEPVLTAPGMVGPRFSLDGKRLVYFTSAQISVYDLARGSTTRLPVQNGSGYPVWTPDGKHIVYESTTGLFWVRSDGSSPPQQIYGTKTDSPVAWSFTPDGRRLAFHQTGEGTGRDIWTLPLDTTDADHPKAGAPELFLATKGNDVEPTFSPDGRWLAYTSSESGPGHVFVRPFPEGSSGGGQVQISTAPGRFPLWSRTAKELFYLTSDGHIMVVPYTINGRSFEPGKPHQWVGNEMAMMTGNPAPCDLAPDGKRFAVFLAPEASASGEKANLHVTFLLNFFDELKRRLPSGSK